LLVATARRAIIIKAGVAATGQFFGKKNASFGYGQITSVDVHTGAMDGYVEISAGGVQNRNLGRTAQLVKADNVCPFNKWGEAAFRQVVEVIRHQLYARPGQAGRAAPAAPTASNIPQQIADLARLHDAGALSNAEFEAKKSELLARM
jgi:Short C-terminal domain